MCDPNKPLSDKHQTFVDIYVQNGRNATEAYKAVYPQSSEESARRLGSKLLIKIDKHPYFVQKNAEIRKKADEAHGINRDWLLEQNKKIYESAMEGDEIPTKDGNVFYKKDRAAAAKAIDQLTKMLGEYADVKAKLQLEGAGKDGAIEIANVTLD